MKKLVCEVCGSPDIIKKDDIFICDSCGCKYTVDEVQKLISENVTSNVVYDTIENRLLTYANGIIWDSPEEALETFYKVKETKPDSYDVWIGIFKSCLNGKLKQLGLESYNHYIDRDYQLSPDQIKRCFIESISKNIPYGIDKYQIKFRKERGCVSYSCEILERAGLVGTYITGRLRFYYSVVGFGVFVTFLSDYDSQYDRQRMFDTIMHSVYGDGRPIERALRYANATQRAEAELLQKRFITFTKQQIDEAFRMAER